MDINTDKNVQHGKFDRQLLTDPKFLRFSIEHLVESAKIVKPVGSQFVINTDVITPSVLKLEKGNTQFNSKAECVDYLLSAIYSDWQMRDPSDAQRPASERRYGTA